MNPAPAPPPPKSRQTDHHHATTHTKAPPEHPRRGLSIRPQPHRQRRRHHQAERPRTRGAGLLQQTGDNASRRRTPVSWNRSPGGFPAVLLRAGPGAGLAGPLMVSADLRAGPAMLARTTVASRRILAAGAAGLAGPPNWGLETCVPAAGRARAEGVIMAGPVAWFEVSGADAGAHQRFTLRLSAGRSMPATQ